MLELKEFALKIGFDDEEIDYILNNTFSISSDHYQTLKSLFSSDNEKFNEQLSSFNNSALHSLAFLLYYMYENQATAKQKNIPDNIYIDTCKDLKIWTDYYNQKRNALGIQNIGWLRYHATFKLFKLGRLQFEPYAFPEDVTLLDKSFKKGDVVYNVHIPQGEKLDYDKCVDSYKMALDFFNLNEITFICSSWLLCPDLKEILPTNSNIIKFQSDFNIYGLNADSRQAEERVFGDALDDISSYPEKTSLQKALKAYLLTGKKMGSASGIFSFKK